MNHLAIATDYRFSNYFNRYVNVSLACLDPILQKFRNVILNRKLASLAASDAIFVGPRMMALQLGGSTTPLANPKTTDSTVT